ncbi:autotransporter assembly complex protein TamA [Aliarcobacter cibarius]|uniref:Putative autotransporter secretion outer membrane protein TamA n=1 Tax=Aliarcobacter cibarius TaxID=255507 RepID=A0A5J6RH73_9BACT|nr:BamA/TamA family outer membrane protein [Aliarcobacter cibarius]QEZ89709.1 putative autotransporter secretion outer membrane protein TamA [Aliarcobacter cibarius]QKJ27719.1 putative autotransporter secretion outer membrane protein TamA [Aliarcobacter cibarius]TLS97727.1 outer membrane protein assembly factor [Aliarcobacter cibarius]TLT05017.1 outer membrane protein assembly factor [Aliarcobacter cibarius]
MFKLFLIISILSLSSFSKEIKTVDFSGDIDLVLGDFSKLNLEKVCDISYPAVYKFWKEKPIFNESDIAICKDLVEEYFHSLGFYKAIVTYEIKEDKANFNIKRNEQIKISSILIEDEYKDIIELKKGNGFKASEFTNSKKHIYKYLNENGYPKAEVDAKAYVDIDEYKVDIEYKVTKNNIQYFGDVNIQNNANVDSKFLEKNIEFKKGEKYNSNLIDKTYENLYNFGIYKYIAIEPNIDTKEDIIPVNVRLVQGDYREITYGIGYDTDTKVKVKAQYKNENFLGDLKSLTIGTKINSNGFEVYNNIYNPYFINDTISLNNDISYEDKDYSSYSQKKIEEKISFSKDFFGLSHTAGFLAQHSTIESELEEYKSGSYLLNSVFYETILDERDDILNPKNGYYLSFYIENGTKALGSEIDYIKTLTQIRYLKTFDKLTSSIKTSVGTLDKDLPIFKHFFAGGDYSNRGYAYQKVGLKDSDDNPYGGLSMIDNSVEFEYAIRKDFGVVTFFDSTMLSLEPNKFDEKFYNSYGFGARYYTPIGPLRVDFGFPLDEGGFVFHIGIGQVF